MSNNEQQLENTIKAIRLSLTIKIAKNTLAVALSGLGASLLLGTGTLVSLAIGALALKSTEILRDSLSILTVGKKLREANIRFFKSMEELKETLGNKDSNS